MWISCIILVCFEEYCFENDQVMTRYFSSAFLGHTTAEDLKQSLKRLPKILDTKKMVQVSMDRPNVNWKMLSNITEERCSMENYPGLINIGS